MWLLTQCDGLLFNRTAFSEDQSHYSWFLRMPMTPDPCKEIVSLSFYGVLSPKNITHLLVFTSTPHRALCFGRILSGIYVSMPRPSWPIEIPRDFLWCWGPWPISTEKKFGYWRVGRLPTCTPYSQEMKILAPNRRSAESGNSLKSQQCLT